MDRDFLSGQLSFPYNLRHDSSDPGQDGMAYQSRVEPSPTNLQSNVTEVSPRSHRSPHYPNGNWDVPGYGPIRQSVPSTPNNQLHFNSQPFFSNGLSYIHDQGCFVEIDNRHVGPIQEYCTAGRGGTNVQVVQGEIMDHFGPHGASCSSDPLGSSSTMTVEDLSSLLTECPSQSYGTSFIPGQVEGTTQSSSVAQEQSTITQKASRRHASEQRIREKRRKDKERKFRYRVVGKQAYARICELLEIDFMPENTRAQRILEGLVEQREVINHLRRQLEEAEEHVDYLKKSYAYIGPLSPNQGPSYVG